MIDKIILEVKKTECAADKIIKDANDKAEIIIDNAYKESDKLIERIKEEAKKAPTLRDDHEGHYGTKPDNDYCRSPGKALYRVQEYQTRGSGHREGW